MGWRQRGPVEDLYVATDFTCVMTRGTRVHYDEVRPESFTDTLEQRARDAISSCSSWEVEGFSASSILRDEIALTLNQLDGWRARDKDLKQDLLHEECDVDTELMQMEQRTPRYSPYRFPEREKLQRRRGRIKEQQRRLTQTAAEKLDSVHDRLLSLLNKRRLLTM